jgi:hypothetical protein
METYFDIRRILKKIYETIQKSIKNKDVKHTNYILSKLDHIEQELGNNTKINAFGMHVLKRDIKQLKRLIDDGIKSIKRGTDEQTSRRNSSK